MIDWSKDTKSRAYDDLVMQLAHAGALEVHWVPLHVEAAGHAATFMVTADAIKVEGVRIDCSAKLNQRIADVLGAKLLTPKLLDDMWKARSVTLPPSPQSITSASKAMRDHSAILQTVGKIWCLTNQLLDNSGNPKHKDGDTLACNYGWHYVGDKAQGRTWGWAATIKGQHTIQDMGFFHNSVHIDYSQVCLLVHQACTVDGAPARFDDIAQNPELAPLLSHEGVLRVLRQPGAPHEDDERDASGGHLGPSGRGHGQPAPDPHKTHRDPTGKAKVSWIPTAVGIGAGAAVGMLISGPVAIVGAIVGALAGRWYALRGGS